MYYKYKIKIVLVWGHFPIGSKFNDPQFSPFENRAKEIGLEMVKRANPIQLSNMISYLQNSGYPISDLEDLFTPFNNFSHFVACSRALHYDNIAHRKDEIYLGPSLSQHSIFNIKEEGGLKKAKESKKPIIYCSMGSWADGINGDRALRFFTFLINCMKQEKFKDFQLLIAAGNFYDKLLTLEFSDNVIIEKWLPQNQLLKDVKMAIIHGGLGSIKECVIEKVPMLVNPLGLDQFETAKMVCKHGLGLQVDVDDICESEFLTKINDLITNQYFIQQLEEMKAIFDKDTTAKNEIPFLEYMIGKPILTESFTAA